MPYHRIVGEVFDIESLITTMNPQLGNTAVLVVDGTIREEDGFGHTLGVNQGRAVTGSLRVNMTKKDVDEAIKKLQHIRTLMETAPCPMGCEQFADNDSKCDGCRKTP